MKSNIKGSPYTDKFYSGTQRLPKLAHTSSQFHTKSGSQGLLTHIPKSGSPTKFNTKRCINTELGSIYRNYNVDKSKVIKDMEIDFQFNKYLKNKYLRSTKWSTQKVNAAMRNKNSPNKGTPIRKVIKKLEQLGNSQPKPYESNYLKKYEGTDLDETDKSSKKEKVMANKETQRTITSPSKPELKAVQLELEGTDSDSSSESSNGSHKDQQNDSDNNKIINFEPDFDNHHQNFQTEKQWKRNVKQEAIDKLFKEIDKDPVSSLNTTIISDEAVEFYREPSKYSSVGIFSDNKFNNTKKSNNKNIMLLKGEMPRQKTPYIIDENGKKHILSLYARDQSRKELIEVSTFNFIYRFWWLKTWLTEMKALMSSIY